MAFIKLPDQDPEACLDHIIDFSAWVAKGNQISRAEAVIESAVLDESPYALSLGQQSPIAVPVRLGPESPEIFDAVRIWLAGGTVGVKYTIKVLVFDDNVIPLPRKDVRRCVIKIRKL